MSSPIPPLIRFSCRGTKISCTMAMLLQHGPNMLSRIVQHHYHGTLKHLMDGEDALFIDCDPVLFHKVLDYFRRKFGPVEGKELRETLDFFEVHYERDNGHYETVRKRYIEAYKTGEDTSIHKARLWLDTHGPDLMSEILKEADEAKTFKEFRTTSMTGQEILLNGKKVEFFPEVAEAITERYGFHCTIERHSPTSGKHLTIDWSSEHATK